MADMRGTCRRAVGRHVVAEVDATVPREPGDPGRGHRWRGGGLHPPQRRALDRDRNTPTGPGRRLRHLPRRSLGPGMRNRAVVIGSLAAVACSATVPVGQGAGLRARRSPPRAASAALYETCDRWSEPDDYRLSLEETIEQS